MDLISNLSSETYRGKRIYGNYYLQGQSNLFESSKDCAIDNLTANTFVVKFGRGYLAFEDSDRFIEWYRYIPHIERSFYEVIRTSSRKFFIDLDKGIRYNDIPSIVNKLRVYLNAIGIVDPVIRIYGNVVPVGEHIYEMDKENPTFHIVLTNYLVPDEASCKGLLRMLTSNATGEEPWSRFIDRGVYGKLQCVRIEGSTKHASGSFREFVCDRSRFRWKVEVSKLSVGGEQGRREEEGGQRRGQGGRGQGGREERGGQRRGRENEYLPPPSPSYVNVKRFKDGLIGVHRSSDRIICASIFRNLSTLSIPSEGRSTTFGSLPVLSTPSKRRPLSSVHREIPKEFKIRKTIASYRGYREDLIVLDRISPSYCYICRRVHEHENAYGFYRKLFGDSHVFVLRCRRADVATYSPPSLP